jgi:hypothetical protein
LDEGRIFMGGFLNVFKGLLGGDPIKSIGDLIDQFHMSPEQKAQLQQAAQQLEVQREAIQAARDEAIAELQIKAITTETSSSDPYVSRARPTFLYIIMAAMAVDLLVIPLIQVLGAAISAVTGHSNFQEAVSGIKLLVIPSPYLELFGASYLGYVGARSLDKTVASANDVAKAPGQSQAELSGPLGLGKIVMKNSGP